MLWWIIHENIILIYPTLFLYDPSNSRFLRQNYFNGSRCFLIIRNSFLFSLHTFAWACVLHLKLSGYACFLYISVISQWISIQLVLQLTLCMHYKYKIYPIASSYSRAYFTQQSERFHNSYLNHKILREDCYINVNCKSTFYTKLLFWLWVMLSFIFSKFDFNDLDLFILLMHIPILKQVYYAIHTYISYCFVF